MKSDSSRLTKAAGLYKKLSTIIITTFLLFVFLNTLLGVAYWLSGDSSNPISEKYGIPLKELYPDLSEEAANAMLIETWTRPYVYEPYTQFKERPFSGEYVKVDENGFRHVEDQGPWPPNPQNINIFVFGGSTVFNYGLPDGMTIASRLQEVLADAHTTKEIYVYNFGRGNYFSSQERVLYEKLLTAGFVPDVAIFIDGLNDFYFHDGALHYTKKIARYVERKRTISLKLPLERAARSLKRFFRKQRAEGSRFDDEKYNDTKLITTVIERYLRNKKLIEAASDAFGIKPLFVWQPTPIYKFDLKYHPFPRSELGGHTYSVYGYPIMKRLTEERDLGKNFLWLADIQEGLKEVLYVDSVHYGPRLSSMLAEAIGEHMTKNGYLP